MSDKQEFRHILIIEDRKGRRIISLEDSNYTLGRDSHNEIVIYDYQVSRTHATLIRKTDYETQNYCYRIIDGDLQGNKSTNGLLINGRSAISHELKHGDTIRFANEAKANYYIIPTNSGIDLFNPNHVDIIKASNSTLTGQSIQTRIDKLEEQSLTDDQQELIRLASFPELSPNPIIELDWNGKITYLNPAASIKFNNIQAEQLNHPILAGLLSEYNNRQGNLFLREVKIGSEVFEQYVHYLSEKKLIRSYIYDFTRRKQVETQLKESEARYRAIVRQTSEGIFLAYANNKMIIEANNAYANLLGYTPAEITNLTLYDLIATDIQIVNQDLANLVNQKQDFVAQYFHRCHDGSLLNLESSISLIRYRGRDIFCFVVRNLSQQAEEQEYSNYQTFHDILTHLPNQKLFNQQLTIALANAKRYQYLMAMTVVEIEQLAKFREVMGEEETQTLIKNFAQTFRASLRAGDLAARWDENKFIALFARIKGPRDPAKVVKRISSTLENYLQEQQQRTNVDLRMNTGMVIYPIDGDDLSSLIKNTLLSLEQAKNPGSNNYGLTGFTISSKTANLLRLENLISNAIKEQQFHLCYQPQVNIQSGQITGLEAILKWDNSELEQITHRHFLRLSEETDFMLPVGVWMLQTSAHQAQLWHQADLSHLCMGVNVSARQFHQSNFVELIEIILQQTNLLPQQLELEIQENCLEQNPEFAEQTMEKLAALQIRLCLDNFGTGNSSLGYLQKLPFNSVKLSSELITDLDKNDQKKAFIQALSIFAQGYNLRVIALGVEKLEQVDLLRNLGCAEIQGNLFSKPLTTNDASNFLQKGHHAIIG
jgi:diguanylate cyclase (GGDEF)-like protein/PAS domain S-box-containing protein